MSESQQEAQGGAYGEQLAEYSDAEERTGEQATPSGSGEAYGQQEAEPSGAGTSEDGSSAQETVEQTQGGFYRDDPVEDIADEEL
jgi:hypothetical protein